MNAIKTATKFVVKQASKYLPEILMTGSAAASIAAVAVAIKRSKKAQEHIEERKEEYGKEELTFGETFGAVWKDYAPVAVLELASVGLGVTSTLVLRRRLAGTLVALGVAEKLRKDREKAIDKTLTSDQKSELNKATIDEYSKRVGCGTEKPAYTGNGMTLIKDSYTGKEFYSEVNTVEKALNLLNRDYIDNVYNRSYAGDWISVNDYMNALGLDDVRFGNNFGWNISNPMDWDIDVGPAADGTPCYIIMHHTMPTDIKD